MPPFDCFVVLAEMRTGSNLVEAALNLLPDVTCHGEAFNPALLGHPKKTELLGMTRAERDADPLELWHRIKAAPGLNGCRYFHDHDPRVLRAMLDDPACGKIILTRNPIESYVSLKIARATGQWKLGDAKHRKEAQASFDAAEFETHLGVLQEFQMLLMHALQTSGQSAFYIDYEDAQDLAVLNGLARWLGLATELADMPKSLVVQNPAALAQKVRNFSQMEASLARLDRFNLSRTPNFEPRRGPNVPGFIGSGAGLLFMPLRSPRDRQIRDWLGETGTIEEGFSQKTLRQWRRAHPGHRSFTVLRHPVLRAYHAFGAVLGRKAMAPTREVLRKGYKLPIPAEGTALGEEVLPDLFAAFLRWLKANLNAQTSLPVAPLWASQAAMVQGFAQFATPDLIAREDRLAQDLGYLAQSLGLEAPVFRPVAGQEGGLPDLGRIWTAQIEKAAREAYPRDYEQFGFSDWKD